MRAVLFALLAAAITLPSVIFTSGGTTAQTPGPSAALFASPYYSCQTNRYVSTTGSDSNNGQTATTAWATLAHADSLAAPGWCVNIANGSYSQATFAPTHGGNTASASGYIVYRCATMNGCTIAAGSGSYGIDLNGQSYIILDGLNVSGSANGAADQIGINANQGSATHHVWVLNSIVSGFTQSGIQLNGHDFIYVLHSTITGNAHNSCFDGSGISYWHLTASNVALTADDKTNPAAAQLGIPTFNVGNGTTFRLVTAWNRIFNNGQTATNCPNTDGNGVIFDDNTGGGYSQPALYAFNLSYNNGGSCMHIFFSQNAYVANNTLYNCYLDPNIQGTFRGTLDDERGSTSGFPNHYYNNISVSVQGTGHLSSNSSLLISSSSFDGNAGNITFKVGGGTEVDFENGVGSGVYSTTANKEHTNPLWVAVGQTSTGSMTAPPNGANFALQSTSPAIGFGVAQPYLPASAADSGACHHSLSTC